MDLQALFKISHGVYLTGAKDQNGRLIGSCIDSAMVVEADPAQIIVSLNKASYTCENVLKTNELTLSVLPENTPNEVIALFGMHTSRNTEKWGPTEHFLVHDLPVYQKSVAYLYVRVNHHFETSGHHVFVCDVVQVTPGTMDKALIYADYQERKQTL